MDFSSIRIESGRGRDNLDQSHLPGPLKSFTNKISSSSKRGPWIADLKGPLMVQLSCQKLSLLLPPGIHLMPFLKTAEPFFIAFHTLEQGSLSMFLEFNLRFEQYLLLSTLAQIESFFL
ncbi:hypothetical protein ACJW30_01G175200 [Castanea mollissima]